MLFIHKIKPQSFHHIVLCVIRLLKGKLRKLLFQIKKLLKLRKQIAEKQSNYHLYYEILKY